MSTAAKWLIVLIAVFCVGFVYLALNVLNIQNAWRNRIATVKAQIETAEEQLEATVKANRETTRNLTILQHGWGRSWHDVQATPQGSEVIVELGQRDGLKESEVLYAFHTGQDPPLYLGTFQVLPNDLAENSAVLGVFPDETAANDPVGQQNLQQRLQLIAQAGAGLWLLRNDLPEGYKQQLLSWTRLVKQQQYNANAAESDRNTWEQTLATSQQHLARREEELENAVAALAEADEQRNVEVRARFETREALRRTVEQLMGLLEENRQLAERLAALETQLVEGAPEQPERNGNLTLRARIVSR